MKRLLTSALAAALVAAGTGGEAQAQDMMGRRASMFDLGVYAGGAWTTDWFEVGGDGYAPELSPIFGATASWFFTPSLGLRLHGAYTPQQLPGHEEANLSDGWLVNSWLYDLGLVFRPWIAREDVGNWMASTYFFVGGGGYTANVAGEGVYPGCIGGYGAGVCVSNLPTLSSVGQANVGFGFDAFPVGSALALFLEGAVHGYRSPAWVAENAANADEKLVFTPRLALGLKAMFGNLIPPPPPVVVPPPPPVAPPPAPPVTPPPPPTRTINVCVVENGMLREVQATYNTATGDTTVNGTAFATAYPSTTGYAANQPFYINNEPVMVDGRRYVKYGLPRVLGVNEVTRVGETMGVSVFAEAGATDTPEVVYLPVRTGCEFQPYQLEVKAGAVRDEE